MKKKIISEESIARAKAKMAKAWNTVKPWIAPIAIFSTIAAAWDGYNNSRRNERELRELKDYASKIDHGAGNITFELDARVKQLEENQQKLLEKAMNITENKEDAA